MRIFVTGATGLLGTRAVQSLLDTQHEVTIVTRSASRAHEHPNLIDAFEFISEEQKSNA